LEVQDLLQSGRITYSNSFFNKRVSLNTSYNISNDETTVTTAGKGGEVTSQIFPFQGFSVLNDTPQMVALLPNPALIDGNTTASGGINIGLPPLAGDTRRRNFGLDLLNVMEVNNLLVWVDRDLSSAPAIANSFSWDIYTSSDNLNWTFFTTIFPAPFGPFQNSFSLNFANVRTRYIKVVTKPLSPAVPSASSFPDIFITELQAFIKKPVESAKGKSKSAITSHIFNLDSRTRILDIPLLFYDLSYFFTKATGQPQNWTLSNGLSVNHTFSSIFSGTGRVAREDGDQQNEKRSAYVYNASLTANPLRTLRHTLVFSGRIEDIDGQSTNTNSLILSNTAELYKGIDVNLSGGLNFEKTQTGERVRNTTINFGSTIVPHPTLTFNINYADTMTHQSGGEKGSSSTFTREVDLTLAYTPLKTVHIFTSISILLAKNVKTNILQNYGINWSPFPDGTLQFNFSFNENLRSVDNAKERIITPSVRWKITNRTFLDLSYQWVKSTSVSQSEDSNVFSASLKTFF
jgi:hypothetical protein